MRWWVIPVEVLCSWLTCVPHYIVDPQVLVKYLLPVKRELTNEYDHFAVAVLKDGEDVGIGQQLCVL